MTTHPARVWVYLGAATLSSAVISSLRPLYTPQLSAAGFDEGTFGIITGATRTFSFLAAPFLGLLIDKLIGVRRAAVFGLGSMVAASLLAIVPGVPLVAVASLALVTFGELFARVALLVLIADCYPALSPGRASAFLLRHVGLNFSFIGLPAMSSFLFATGSALIPSIICAATAMGAVVLVLLSPEAHETAQPPVRTGVTPLMLFTLLGLATAAVNVLCDNFTTGRFGAPTGAAAASSAFFQMLNPLLVVVVGVPVAIMWTRADIKAVGRIAVILASLAFLICGAEALLAFGSDTVDAPMGASIALVNGLGAIVEVLAWPLSTALVSSAAPLAYRATYLGTWTALAGLPYAISVPFQQRLPATVILLCAALSLALAVFFVLARTTIAAFADSFAHGNAGGTGATSGSAQA